MAAIGAHQAITHLQIGLLVSQKIGMKPLLLFGWQIQERSENPVSGWIACGRNCGNGSGPWKSRRFDP